MASLTDRLTRDSRRLLRQAASLPALDFFPIRAELRGYDRATLKADFSAALSLALLTLPMSMAIALMIGMPVTAGIVGGAVAAVVGPLFGCSRFVAPGPTNGSAALMLSAFLGLAAAGSGLPDDRTALVVPMVLLTGLILVSAAFLRVANFTGFISRTVVTAYVTCAAERIITNQLPLLLGVDLGGDGLTFVRVVGGLWQKIGEVAPAAVGVAVVTWVVQSLLTRWRPAWPNLFITLVLVSLTAAGLKTYGPAWLGMARVECLESADLALSGRHFAPVSTDQLGQLFSPAMAMAFLCVLEATSIGRSLAAQAGRRINGHEVLFGMGMANIASAFVGGLPVSGSLTRSAAAISAGARTAVSGVMSGVVIAVVGFTLGPWLGWVPKAALGAVVCRAALALFSPRDVRACLTATTADKVVYLLTFGIGLVAPLDTAIYFGVGLSIALFLRQAAAPEIVEYAYNEQGHLAEVRGESAGAPKRDPEVSIVHVEGNLFFGAADLFTDQTRRVAENPDLKVLVLKFRNAHHLDATGVLLLTDLHAAMRKRGAHLLVCELRGEIIKVLRDSRAVAALGSDNLFVDTPANPPLSAARALRRARKLLGGASARVSVYAKPANTAPARVESRASADLLPRLYEDKPDFYGEL